MNYYIDFDNTLYNTRLLVDNMFNSIVDTVYTITNSNKQTLFDEVKYLFSRENKHIYEVSKIIADKYNIESKLIIDNLKTILSNGSAFVFKDSVSFLQKLKDKDHNIFLLTFANKNIEYQTLKVLGSGLTKYFDALYITNIPKYELNIAYSDGIFVDDNPKDLKGLYLQNARKLIRIKRKENSHSSKKLVDVDIEEYDSLEKISID